MQVIPGSERIKDGEPILEEGTWAYYGYVLKSGKAKVFKNINGQPVMIGTLKEGDVFGEVAFLGGAKRTASVIADGDVEVDMIPRDSFFEALNELPEDLRSKLRALVSDLTLLDEVRGRLLTFLPELRDLQAKRVDLDSLEKDVEDMPEIMGRVVRALVQRLNVSIDGMAKLGAQAEETVKVIDSLS